MPSDCLMGKSAACLALACFAVAQPVSAGSTAADLNNRAVEQAQAGRFEEAVIALRQAHNLDPGDQTVRKNLSRILFDYARQKERGMHAVELIKWLKEAVSLDDKNGPAWALLGNLHYYRENDPQSAIQAWQRAIPLAPSDISRALADRVSRTQRDEQIERRYGAATTAHFIIKVQQDTASDLKTLSRLLEEAYSKLQSELGGNPPVLNVIVYTEQGLKRVSGQRDWSVGLYDGRLRLRVDELTQPLLPDLIRHELTHAFLHHLYGPLLPVWVHEGYAQSHESEQAAALRPASTDAALQAGTSWIPLKWLDGHFQQPSNREDLMRAYAESRLAVGRIIARQGIAKFKHFLAALQRGQESGAAFDVVFSPWRWSRFEQGIVE